jgi:phosphatidylglycerol:prolipoprotein diacylglycerol transferase
VTFLVLTWPHFDPVALRLGPLSIRWYGLMYALAFLAGYVILQRRVTREPYSSTGWTKDDVGTLIFDTVAGVIGGGRLGYVLFYKPVYYATHPLDILKLWDGGMSFHGGAIGVMLALWWFARHHKRTWLEVTDLLVPLVPIGLGLGRFGNFINGELWGRAADPSLPWAMVFPQADSTPRHPSQLYEMLLEGIVLFVLLWLYQRRRPFRGAVSAAFLIGYGVFRFTVEHFREPDDYLGFLGLGLTMGQWLCVPMVIAGAAMWLWSRSRSRTATPVVTADPATDLAGPTGTSLLDEGA